MFVSYRYRTARPGSPVGPVAMNAVVRTAQGLTDVAADDVQTVIYLIDEEP